MASESMIEMVARAIDPGIAVFGADAARRDLALAAAKRAIAAMREPTDDMAKSADKPNSQQW